MNVNVHSNTIHSSQKVDTIQMSINRWIKKCNISIKQYYSAIKRKVILTPATTLMVLENIMLCEISQTDTKDKYMFSLI